MILFTKGIIKSYKVVINGKNFYDQPIYADVKRYKEIRKLQHEKANIMLLGVCWIMITSKTITN